MRFDRTLESPSWTRTLVLAGLAALIAQTSAADPPDDESIILKLQACTAERPAEAQPQAAVAAKPPPPPPPPPSIEELHELLEFETFQLGYVDIDRALPLIRALGYTTISFDAGGAMDSSAALESIRENFATLDLPVVIGLRDASGADTTLVQQAAGSMASAGEAIAGVPNIGGTHMPNTTTGEPQQRLLIVYEKHEQIHGLLKLLRDQIDVPSRQIVIEALVVEINSDRLRDIGVELGAQGGDFAYQFGLRTMGQFFSPFTLSFDDRGQGASFITATLSALVEEGEADILSNPSVLVLDGRQARIQIGQQIPVITSSANINVVSSSVSYFPVGIVLNLRPRVNLDGSEVTMQVETIVSAISAEGGVESTTEGGLAVVAPTIDNRQVQSFVRVNDGTPFIIGGLISEEERKTTSRIPGLSRLPWIGKLFRRRQSDRLNQEVIILLTPHVVPEKRRNFSFLIPRPSKFDRLVPEHRLFRSAYRIRDEDVWDLKAFLESESIREARRAADEMYRHLLALEEGRKAENSPLAAGQIAALPAVLLAMESRGAMNAESSRLAAKQIAALPAVELALEKPDVERSLRELRPPGITGPIKALEQVTALDGCLRTVATLLRGDLPGEEALVHRMLWNIASKNHADFSDQIPLEKVRFFSRPAADGYHVDLKKVADEQPGEGHNAVILDLTPPTEPGAKPGIQESVNEVKSTTLPDLPAVREKLTPTKIVLCWRCPGVDETGNTYDEWAPANVLRNVLVVKRILELNPDLPLTVRGFYAGREIAFPTANELSESNHIIDREVAGLFYDVSNTYTAFGESYERQKGKLAPVCKAAFRAAAVAAQQPPDATAAKGSGSADG